VGINFSTKVCANDKIIVALNADTLMENNMQMNIINTIDHIVGEPIKTKDETHIEPLDDTPGKLCMTQNGLLIILLITN
jgi:hypothetical protein